MSYAAHFGRFLKLQPQPLYFASHRLHPFPDVGFEAQQQAWLDSATDNAAQRLPKTLAHIAHGLNLPDSATLLWAASADSLLTPLFDSAGATPLRVLCMDPLPSALATTLLRLERLGRAQLTLMHPEPFKTFEARWNLALRKSSTADGFDWVCLDQCCAETGFVAPGLNALARNAADCGAQVLIDGSRGFMALGTDLSDITKIASYIAAAPAYAMSGDGYGFLHRAGGVVAGSETDAQFDPGPLYRFIAAMDWIKTQGLTAATIHAHVGDLQARFLSRLDALRLPLSRHNLLPPLNSARGNFLCFALTDADVTRQALAQCGVLVDADEEFLRIGFDIHHTDADVDALLSRLRDAPF